MPERIVSVTVNGDRHSAAVEDRRTLVDFLRDECRLTGTHIGCEHGVCGACTVLVDGRAVRSCLMLAVQADGHDVRTVEGLAGPDGHLHPAQEAFNEHHALQCGFCTPGFLMTVVGLMEEEVAPSPDQVLDAIAGHLCRCTGYQGILRAVEQLTDVVIL